MEEFKHEKARLVEKWMREGILTWKDERLIKAFLETPREKFISREYKQLAYVDTPLPLIRGATISQPTTIIIMTKLLNVKQNNKVLEIGTGSGYQAALLSKIAKKVITIEIEEQLYKLAKKNITKLNIKNIKLVLGDGKKGYKKEAPYDRIIITAATNKIPEELIKQLSNKGILLAPIGEPWQTLARIKKEGNKIKHEFIKNMAFAFVKLK